jgi:ABC-2 type transport system ATP-binding protein
MDPQIVVRDLRKVYRVPEREAGLRAALGSLFHRRYRDVLAVDDIHFAVQPGEVVGFIGPNGAGKTTTLKMLSGLLYPTSGEARVEGFVPWERKSDFLRRITMVMGNRQQLAWDNTVSDCLVVQAEIYRVPRVEFRHILDELVDLLEIEDLLPKMARDLSLGERMRCELAAALLHRPRVLFLDEPTLGLDVTMQFRLRRFIADYNRRHGATVILTSHYMADVVSLCPRVILIHQGRLLFDGELARLAEQMAPFKLIRVATGDDGDGRTMENFLADLGQLATVVGQSGRQYTLRVPKAEASSITARLLRDLPLVDLTVEDPPIEAVIDQVYREGVNA